jgi:hypothetical protein
MLQALPLFTQLVGVPTRVLPNGTEPAAVLDSMTMVAGTMPGVGLTMEALLTAAHKRLMTIWRQSASAPWTNLLGFVDGLGCAVYLYAVDGSAEKSPPLGRRRRYGADLR